MRAHTYLPIAFSFLTLLIVNTVSANSLKAFNGPTPNLDLADTLGNHHQLLQYRGTPVLVQFWATYCIPCRKEIPSMNRLQKKLGEQIKILAINIGESEEKINKFVKQLEPNFTILLDHEGEALHDWNVIAAPASFLIGPDGKVHYSLYGETEWDSEEIIQVIEAL